MLLDAYPVAPHIAPSLESVMDKISFSRTSSLSIHRVECSLAGFVANLRVKPVIAARQVPTANT